MADTSEPILVPVAENDELKSVTESLYKQNLEIAARNKTLSLLGKLYEISIQTLPPRELATEITKTVQADFSFERVAIILYDESEDELVSLGFAESERFHEARKGSAAFFDELDITKASSHSFFKKALESHTFNYTEDLPAAWGDNLSLETIEKIQSEGHARSLVAYPLIIGKHVMGIFILTLNRTYDELVSYEKESIASIINVITVALDKARLYQELTISNKKLEKANDQQVILIHFITHQLKGFVTKSRNIFSVLLEGDFGALPDTMKPLIEEGFRSDTKGAETIQEILNAANIKSGKVSYDMKPFDLKVLVEDITKDLKPAADAKGLELKLDLGSEPLQFTGDRAQLLNALKNLIDNSIKYTPKGTVEVVLHKENDKIHFEIKDTGVGITPEDMANLFTEGGHGKESQKINTESTGFGLYIVKNIIEGHHGKVWAESEGAGKGSRFIVELPITQPQA